MTAAVQRWRDGRDRYRPAAEPIDPRAYEVAELEDDTRAKGFVLAHHYSGTYPAARRRFGLYRGAELAGVAVFSHPCSDKVLTSVFPGPALEALELGRFVLLDDVPGNGETWFLGRCFQALRAEGFRGVVSFSDPLPRTNRQGARVFAGHIGTIYQAHNGVYFGRATARTLQLLPDGQVFSARAAQKIRAGDRGWEYAAAQLEAAGAPSCDRGDRRGWLTLALARVARPVRHPGNHKYAWSLDRRRPLEAPGLPYPKRGTDLWPV